MKTTAELIENLNTLVGESSREPSLADESEDLMTLSGKPSGESSFAEDGSTPDLMPLFENVSLENLSPKELILFLKDKPVEKLPAYAILGVTKETSKEDIRKKYLALAALAHPDRGEANLPLCQAMMEAYQSLVEKSTISPHEEEDERNIANEEEFFASVGAEDIFLLDVDDYLPDPKKKQLTLYDKRPHDPNEAYVQRGRALIEQNYAPYISYKKFLNLHPTTQKELAILLAKQEEAYKGLKTNSNYTDPNNLTKDDIYDSIDLDSPHLEEVRGTILRYCQQASLDEQSLNFLNKHILNAQSIAAITTDVVVPDSTETVEQDFTQISDLDASELYLKGWFLLRGEEGIKSGALQLFLQYPGPERRELATAVGRYQAEYPGNNLKSIFDYYDIGNKEKREAAVTKLRNINLNEFFLFYKEKYGITRIEDSNSELGLRFNKLCPSEIMEKFVEELRKVPVSKDDNDWYQLGISLIEEAMYGLTKSAFLFLSPEAQRDVAIQLGKQNKGLVVSELLDKRIAWANNQESADKIGRKEIEADRAYITKSQFDDLAEEKQRSIAIQIGARLFLGYDDSPEPRDEKKGCAEKNEEKSKLLDEEVLSDIPLNTISQVSTQFSFFENLWQKSLVTSKRMVTYEPQLQLPPKKRRKIDTGTPELSPSIEY